eukprot:tig00001110_g7083.t1
MAEACHGARHPRTALAYANHAAALLAAAGSDSGAWGRAAGLARRAVQLLTAARGLEAMRAAVAGRPTFSAPPQPPDREPLPWDLEGGSAYFGEASAGAARAAWELYRKAEMGRRAAEGRGPGEAPTLDELLGNL